MDWQIKERREQNLVKNGEVCEEEDHCRLKRPLCSNMQIFQMSQSSFHILLVEYSISEHKTNNYIKKALLRTVNGRCLVYREYSTESVGVCIFFFRNAQLYMPNVIYLHLNSITRVISFSPGSSLKLSSLPHPVQVSPFLLCHFMQLESFRPSVQIIFVTHTINATLKPNALAQMQ